MSSIEDVRKEYGEVQNSSLEASRRLVSISSETSTIATETLVNLDSQKEVLIRTNNRLNDTHDYLNKAEKSLSEMERWCCGIFPAFWKGPTKKYSDKRTKNIFKKNRNLDISSDESKSKNTQLKQKDKVMNVVTDPIEDEINKNLDIVGDTVKELKVKALVMSSELDEHKKILDTIDSKVDHLNTKVKDASGRTIALM